MKITAKELNNNYHYSTPDKKVFLYKLHNYYQIAGVGKNGEHIYLCFDKLKDAKKSFFNFK